MLTGKRILRSDLHDFGIMDAYIGKVIEDAPCGHSCHSQIIRYAEKVDAKLRAGRGLYLYGGSNKGKSLLANLVAQSALAQGHSALVISLSFLSAVRFGGGFEGGKDAADRFFKRSFMEFLQADFLIIDDLCDALMEERANYYLKATFHDTVKYRASCKKPLIVTTRMGLSDTAPCIEGLFGASVVDTLRTKCQEVFVG